LRKREKYKLIFFYQIGKGNYVEFPYLCISGKEILNCLAGVILPGGGGHLYFIQVIAMGLSPQGLNSEVKVPQYEPSQNQATATATRQ